MIFKEKARIFVQLIIFKASSPIFVSQYLSKKELTCISIHVCKIFKCKVSFNIAPGHCWELWKQLISSNFQNGTFEIMTITETKFVLIQVFFLPFLLNNNKKIYKNEKTEYHGTFRPFKNQLHLKPGSPIFLLFRSWSLVLYLYLWVNSKFFLVDVSMKAANKFSVFLTGLNG